MKVHCCLIILLMAATIYSKYSDHRHRDDNFRHSDNDYRHRDKNFRHGDNTYRHRDDNIRHRDKYHNGQCKIMARTPQQWVDALNVFIYQNRDGNVCASEDLVIRLAKYPNNQQLQLSSIDPSESFWTLVGDGNSLNQMNEIRELRAEGISSAKEIKEGLLRKTIDRIGKKIHKKLQTNTSQKWFFHVISKRAIRKLISSQSYDFFIPSWDNLFRYMEYFVYCKWVDGKDMCDEDHPISVKFHPSIKRGLKEKSLEEIIGCSEGVVRCCYKNPHSQFCEFHQILLEKRSHGGKIEAVRYYADIQHGRTLQEARALFSAVFEYYPNDNDRLEEALTAELDYTGGLGVLMRGDINMYDMEPIGASLFLART